MRLRISRHWLLIAPLSLAAGWAIGQAFTGPALIEAGGIAGDCVQISTAAANTLVDSGGACGGSGSVHVTAGNAGIVVSPSPGTGTFTVALAAALPSGTTATSQSAGDNSTKVATTAYADRPFSSTQPGAVPASGGGTTNFLRADGSFAAPSGGGGGPVAVCTVALSTTFAATLVMSTTSTPACVINSTYNRYTLVATNLMATGTPTGNNYVQLSVDGGSTWFTSTYSTAGTSIAQGSGNTPAGQGNTTDSGFLLPSVNLPANISFSMDFSGLTAPASVATITETMSGNSVSNGLALEGWNMNGWYYGAGSAGPVNALRIIGTGVVFGCAALSECQVTLYGDP